MTTVSHPSSPFSKPGLFKSPEPLTLRPMLPIDLRLTMPDKQSVLELLGRIRRSDIHLRCLSEIHLNRALAQSEWHGVEPGNRGVGRRTVEQNNTRLCT